MYRNIRLTHSSMHTVCGNADRIKESAKSGTEVFVWQDYHSPMGMNRAKICGCYLLTFYCISNK
jgi:hypothetical protein